MCKCLFCKAEETGSAVALWQLNRTVLCWEGRTLGSVWNKADVGMEMVICGFPPY